MSHEFQIDWQRLQRTHVPEVVLAEHKSAEQLLTVATLCVERQQSLFMTRVSADKATALESKLPGMIHFHQLSGTLLVAREPLVSPVDEASSEATEPAGSNVVVHRAMRVAIVAGGTSDMPVVAEIEQTLLYLGEPATRYVDVGVAGLWRLLELTEKLSGHSIIIAVAGMEGALFSVLAGLVRAPVIAVPVSVGYGVGQGGHVALNSALSSCAPGIAVVNIDNGFGAAALAIKMLAVSET
jgi:NCAIR mutase (PurE)-related protein